MKNVILLLFTCLGVSAATPSFSSFAPTQFATNNLIITIKDGAVITNLNVITDLFINSTNIVNLFAPSSVTNGGGGDSIWTNITGYVTMIPGQTATNTLAFTSGAADNATNILLKVDSANYLSASGSLLAWFGNAGTNAATIGRFGGITLGRFTEAYTGYSADSGPSLLNINSPDNGDPANWEIWIGSQSANGIATLDMFGTTNSARITMVGGGTNNTTLDILANDPSAYLIMYDGNQSLFELNPKVASSGTAVAYLFDTSNTLTNGDKFVSIGNAGTEVLNISPNSTGAQIVFGPGSTNVLSRSGSNLVYTNADTAGYGLTIQDPSNATKFAQYQVLPGGSAKIVSASSAVVFLAPDNGNVNYGATSSAFSPAALNLDLGGAASNDRWRDLHLDRNIVWNGTTNNLFDTWGTATPEGAQAARPGSVFRNTADAGVLLVKTDGTSNTGWQPVHVGNQAYLAANGTVSDATLVNLSLSVGVTSGKKYAFRCVLYCANSTAGDGVKIDFDGGSAAATNFRAHTKITDVALLTSTQTSALATDITAVTITGDTEIEVNGSFEPSGTGTLIPRFAENSDGGGTLTVYRGSHLILTEIP